MTNAQTITRFAPAKVNLALAVGPPRAGDGLHPICSWIAPLDFGDTLTLSRLAVDELSRFDIRWAPDAPRPSPIDWPIEKDLAVRAHRAMEAEVGRPLPVALALDKRTPVGAGLGGGSSDAAAALIALRDLFHLPVSDDRLRAIGLGLGADVPVFLPPGVGAPAIVEGVGELVVRTPRIRGSSGGPQSLLLVFPDFGCPTGAVYRAFDDASPPAFRADQARAMARRGVIEPDALFNDLASPAEQVAPRLSPIRELARRISGLPVHVTGSGSGLFIVLEDGEECTAFGAACARAIGEHEPSAAAIEVQVGP